MARIGTLTWASAVGMALAVGCHIEPQDEEGAPTEGTGGSSLKPEATTGEAGSQGVAKSDDADDDVCPVFEGLNKDICNSDSRVAKPQPVNLLLVIDKSKSMDDGGTYQNTTKWSAMTQALTSALRSVISAESTVKSLSVGLMLFPDKAVFDSCVGEPCCDLSPAPINVEVGSAVEQVPLIVEELESTGPSGSTPTAAALAAAFAYYTTGAGAELEGHKYVLLATDGGPNCNLDLACDASECTLNLDAAGACSSSTDTCCSGGMAGLWCVDHAATVERIALLRQADVKTIVVGIPGTEAYKPWLNAFAVAGDAVAPQGEETSYYEVSASGGVPLLEQTLKDITTHLVNSCQIQLAENPPLYDSWFVNVAIDCKLIQQSSPSADGSAGAANAVENWRVDDTTSPVTIELLGQYCDRVKAGVERVDVIVDCPIWR